MKNSLRVQALIREAKTEKHKAIYKNINNMIEEGKKEVHKDKINFNDLFKGDQ